LTLAKTVNREFFLNFTLQNLTLTTQNMTMLRSQPLLDMSGAIDTIIVRNCRFSKMTVYGVLLISIRLDSTIVIMRTGNLVLEDL
jgi:hypothetical protein